MSGPCEGAVCVIGVKIWYKLDRDCVHKWNRDVRRIMCQNSATAAGHEGTGRLTSAPYAPRPSGVALQPAGRLLGGDAAMWPSGVGWRCWPVAGCFGGGTFPRCAW